MKIINFSSQRCPLYTTVSRYSNEKPVNFGGNFGRGPSSRVTVIHKAHFAYKTGEGGEMDVCTEICALNWKQAALRTDGGGVFLT